jgi:carboxyl-terminal processing protease
MYCWRVQQNAADYNQTTSSWRSTVQDCRDLTTDDAARLLRGNSGSQVNLTFETPSGTQKSNTFTRQRVQIHSITRKVILDETRGIGYIRMEGFQSNTAEELDVALRELERKGMKALIWDLRGNPAVYWKRLRL